MRRRVLTLRGESAAYRQLGHAYAALLADYCRLADRYLDVCRRCRAARETPDPEPWPPPLSRKTP